MSEIYLWDIMQKSKYSLDSFRAYRDYMDMKFNDTCTLCCCKKCCEYLTAFEKGRHLKKEVDCDETWEVWNEVDGPTFYDVFKQLSKDAQNKFYLEMDKALKEGGYKEGE